MCDRPPFTSRAVSRSIDLLITTVIWRIWNIVGLVLVRWIHQCKSPEFKITGALSIKRVIIFLGEKNMLGFFICGTVRDLVPFV